MTLSGCSGSSQDGRFAGSSQTERLEGEWDKLAKTEQARKAAVRKLSVALKANKAKDSKLRAVRSDVRKYRAQIAVADNNIAELETRLASAAAPRDNPDEAHSTRQSEQLAERLKAKEQELLAAQEAAKKYCAELQAADHDVADLEIRLAEATAPQAEAEETRSARKRSGELVESLKARLDETSKERDALKTQLDEAQKDVAATVEKMRAAAAEKEKQAKQQVSKAEATAAPVNGTSASVNQCSSR